ncbi:XRE family transcriptional regulator [Streptomyces sp. NPDC093060]|uniref:XRE family transcriptional regulator n=1 Tax=Streptomyces sp. NPDC093060 TaxID=3366019 RepID=UPI0037F1B91A
MEHEERTEDLAQLLARLKSEYDVNDSEIARRISVAPATVNAWVHRKRGTGRGPRPDKLRALAAAYPKFTEDEIFAAAGRTTPGPLDADREARVLEYFRLLTEEQQRAKEIEMRALSEANQTKQG